MDDVGFADNRDFVIFELLSTIACITNLIVAILGDGRLELPKQLFFSNVLFDVAAIVFLNGVLVFCFEFTRK
jgi:hypothetical protein